MGQITLHTKKEIRINKEKLIDELKIFHGIPPHEGMSNYCQGDGYYARSLEKKYGASIEELSNAVGFQEIIDRWENLKSQI